MANELRIASATANTIYAHAFRISDDTVRDVTNSKYVAFVVGNWADYVLVMTEVTGSGYYNGDFTPGTTAATYLIVYYDQSGGSPASTDSQIGDASTLMWSGEAEVAVGESLETATTAASNVELTNIALSILGQERITSLGDDNKRARLANNIFNRIRDGVLEDHRWNCAIKRQGLAKSATAPAFGPANAFQLPSDFIRLSRTETSNDKYFVERDDVVTDLDSINLVYIFRLTDVAKMSEGLKQAISQRLAAEMALNLTGSNSTSDRMWKIYRDKITRARFVDSDQTSRQTIGGSTWIEGRLDAPAATPSDGWADSV